MSTVIDFKPVTARRRPNMDQASKGAEIVIFPGVRYEYHEPDDARGRSRPRRDRLDLE